MQRRFAITLRHVNPSTIAELHTLIVRAAPLKLPRFQRCVRETHEAKIARRGCVPNKHM
jgi:hypothetical protein